MALFAALVDTGDLISTVWVSFVAGLTVAFVSSLAIWGAARYVDLSQEGRSVAAYGALAVGGFGFLSTVAVIALGLYLMIAG